MGRTSGRVAGVVRRLVRDKGFGFVQGDGQEEYFFHRSAAPEFDSLTEGERVEFEPGRGAKCPRAENVTRA